jgi:hypothetical protein
LNQLLGFLFRIAIRRDQRLRYLLATLGRFVSAIGLFGNLSERGEK